MSTIFYFRGFNTYPDENLHFGPLDFGKGYLELERAFAAPGFRLLPIPGCGRGPLATQIEHCRRWVVDAAAVGHAPAGRGPETTGATALGTVHFLGHSFGGIVARGTAHALRDSKLDLRSVTTLNSPHRGAIFADNLVRAAGQPEPLLYRLLRWMKYDFNERREQFAVLQTSELKRFNTETPDRPDVKYASVVSEVPLHAVSWLFRSMRFSPHWHKGAGDGLLEVESQAWGQVLMQTQLDHGAVIGLRTVISPWLAKQQRLGFEQMVTRLAAFMRSVE